MAQYRVIVGLFETADPKSPDKSIIYIPGDIIESPVDLVAKFGEKFERLNIDIRSDEQRLSDARKQVEQLEAKLRDKKAIPVPNEEDVEPTIIQTTASKSNAPTREELESMTVADLRRLADAEEINLHGAMNKREIVHAILTERRN